MALATNQFTITNMTEGVSISLSQDSIVIQVEYDGSGGVFGTSATSTTASVFVGGADDSANWTFTPTGSGVTGTSSNNGRTFTITSMPTSGYSGTITFSASKAGFSTLTKTCTVGKVKNGSIESIPMYKTPVDPDNGLFYNSTHFGFFDGVDWKTYMDNKGNFALGDPVNDKGIVWNNESNPKTLAVSGQIIMRSGSSLDRTTPYYSGSKPTIICARKSPSDTTTTIATAKRLQALGYSVTWTTFDQTVFQCGQYDIILVDHYVWGADADNTFIKSAFNAGKKILVTGNDSTSALFYISSNSASSMLLGPRLKTQSSHAIYTGWSTLPDDPDTGRAITGVLPEAKILTNHTNGGSIADVFILRNNIGGVLVHAQSSLGRNPTSDSDRFLTNIIEYMAGNLVADTSEIGFINGVSASTVQDGSNRATVGLTTDGYISQIIKGSTLRTDGMVAGLNITKDYLGYYDGSQWKSYIDRYGNFKFGDGINGHGIAWDQSSGVMAIRGDLVADDIKAGGTLSGQNISGGTITIGSINSIFKADSNGIYLGNSTFANAPFSVSMTGALIASNARISGAVAPTLSFKYIGTGSANAVNYPYTYVRKLGSVDAWDANTVSNEAYEKECFASWTPNNTTCYIVAGLTLENTTYTAGKDSIFGWYMISGGTGSTSGALAILENGVDQGVTGYTYNNTTVLSVTYDNQYIRYYKDGVQIKQTTVGSDKSYVFNSAFKTAGARLNYVKFGHGKLNSTFLGQNGIYTGAIVADQITAGIITGSTLQTSSSATVKRFVVSKDSGEAYFYGDQGNGTVSQLASIGITGSAGDETIGYFGSATSSRVAIRAYANFSKAALTAQQWGSGAGGHLQHWTGTHSAAYCVTDGNATGTYPTIWAQNGSGTGDAIQGYCYSHATAKNRGGAFASDSGSALYLDPWTPGTSGTFVEYGPPTYADWQGSFRPLQNEIWYNCSTSFDSYKAAVWNKVALMRRSATVPTSTTTGEDFVVYKNGTTYRLYIRVAGDWHYVTLT